MSDETRLTPKQRVFVDKYVQCFNASKAAREAGYKDNANLHTNATKLLQNTTIQTAIQERLADVHMSADEALKLMADIARGDIAQLMDVSSVGFNLDMAKAKELGLTKLIKKVKQKTTTYIAKKESEEDREVTELEIELYNAQDAVRDVLKVHGRFAEKVEHEHDGEIRVVVEYANKDDNPDTP